MIALSTCCLACLILSCNALCCQDRPEGNQVKTFKTPVTGPASLNRYYTPGYEYPKQNKKPKDDFKKDEDAGFESKNNTQEESDFGYGAPKNPAYFDKENDSARKYYRR